MLHDIVISGCTKSPCTTIQCKSKNAALYCTDIFMCCEQDVDECDKADQGIIIEAEDNDKVEDMKNDEENLKFMFSFVHTCHTYYNCFTV